MILQTEIVEQCIEGGVSARFVKSVMATREGAHPIAIVHKRLASLTGNTTKAAVMLVHGFGQNRYSWHTSKRSFSAYLAAAGYDVFNVDLRGRGRSRRFGARRDSGIDDYIREDVPAAIETALRLSGQDQIFLIGHSLGGVVSYGVAGSSMSEKVAGIVTIGSPYRFGKGSVALRIAGPMLASARFTGIFDADPPVNVRRIGRHLLRFLPLWDSRLTPLPVRPWLPGSIERDILRENVAASFEHSRVGIALNIISLGEGDALKSRDGLVDYGLAFELLDRPLLVISGTHDSLVPPASARPAYERSRASDKTYREFPMGHIDLVIGRDAPSSVWRLIRSWLDARVESSEQQAGRETPA